MKFSFHSLPVRLSIWICAVLLLCLSAAAILIGGLWMRRLNERLNDQGVNTASETAYMLDRIFLQAEQAAELAAATLEANPPAAIPPFLREIGRAMNAQCRELNGLGIAFKENMLPGAPGYNFFVEHEQNGVYTSVHLTDETQTLDYCFRDWFVVPLALERPVWTVPYHSAMNDRRLILSYAVPFFRPAAAEGQKKESAGVVEVAIQVDDLAKFLDNTALKGLRNLSRSGEIFLMNQFGRIVLYPGREELLGETIFTLCDEPDNPDPADRRAARQLFAGRSGKILLHNVPKLMGRGELFHAACVNGWTVCIVIPHHWQVPLLMPSLVRFLLGTLFILAVTVAVIFIICRKLNAPLLQLARAARKIGEGNFSAPLPDFRRRDEIGHLADSFRQMQSELADYIVRLEETVAARERSEGELNAAKAIQQDILPHLLPPVPDCPDLVCAADLIPARGVGGDLYDIFPVDRDHWALIIGDVAGKGVPAALFMAVTQTLQRSIAQTIHTPEGIVTRLNRMLAKDNTTAMFVTYWLGILNVRTGELAFTNGGHNPPLLRRADGAAEFLTQRHGPMLGVVPDKQYRSETITLAAGDLLILYTDGVTEAFDREERMFGEDGLAAAVAARSAGDDPAAMLAVLEQAVAAHADGVEQADDITLLLARYGSPEPAEKRLSVAARAEELNTVMAFFDRLPAVKGWSPKVRNQVRVCVEEIFANIVMHGYAGKAGPVDIEIREEAGQLRIRFADLGKPFNPLEHPEPDLTLPVEKRPIGGLGIFLIRRQMDFCDYRHENGRNLLTIGKNLPSPPHRHAG